MGYQERLVDWDNVPERVNPGATIDQQLTTTKPTYFNYYESPTHNSYQSSSFGSQQSGVMIHSKSISRQSINNSCLPMYPIDESPFDEEYLRPKTNYWHNNRPIPIIQEPNQTMFLTIPSHNDRYPPYPPAPPLPPVRTNSIQTRPHLLFPGFNGQGDRIDLKGSFTIYNESTIPYIDQTDDSTKEIDDDTKNKYSQSNLINKKNSSTYKSIDEEIELKINIDGTVINRNISTGNNSITHCCCHSHTVHCKEHRLNDSVEEELTRSQETSGDNNLSDASEESWVSTDSQNTKDINYIKTTVPTLDLSGLNSEISSDDSNNTEKILKSPEKIRLGCGRVAALAKHFSKLGDSGLIKFKTTKLNSTRQFVSEPDMTSPQGHTDTDSCYKKSSIKEFKSETDLLKVDKNIATSPEKEWNMILLDIQAKSAIEMDNYIFPMSGYLNYEKKKANDNDIDTTTEELKKSHSKLSLAEQEEIIEQLKEFCNLDNVDAPLYIPETEIFHDEINNEKKMSSNENTDSTGVSIIEIPRYNNEITGKIKMENFRKNSLPTILTTHNISPGIQVNNKINKLEKYWSLKDLMSSDDIKLISQNDNKIFPKYFVFPSCSRVISAPEISHDNNIHNFQVHSLNSSRYGSGNVTINSTISINNDDYNKQEINNTVTQERASSPIKFNKENFVEKKLKFPNSFIRTKKISQSDNVLNKKLLTINSKEFSEKIISKSLEKIGKINNDNNFSINQSYNNTTSKNSLDNINKKKLHCNKHFDDYYSTIPIKSNSKVAKPIRKKSLIMRKLSKSDLDVSERKPTPRFERGDWIFRDFPPLEVDTESRKLWQNYVIDGLIVFAHCLVQLRF